MSSNKIVKQEQIELIIDHRERELLKYITSTHKTEALDIGDIMFKKNDEIIFIIERKTIQDLKASICDGRLREQKARILGSGVSSERILYLIEGNLDKAPTENINGIPVSTLLGSIINTQLRDNIKVYKTSSIQESAIFIDKLCDKLSKELNNYFKQEEKKITNSEYAATLKTVKKKNMTPEVWFIVQLALIPQVTEKISEVIGKKYVTLIALIKEYETVPEHLRPKLLSDLEYDLSTGKKRRVGDKISKKIYEYLYQINNE